MSQKQLLNTPLDAQDIIRPKQLDFLRYDYYIIKIENNKLIKSYSKTTSAMAPVVLLFHLIGQLFTLSPFLSASFPVTYCYSLWCMTISRTGVFSSCVEFDVSVYKYTWKPESKHHLIAYYAV